MVLTERFLAALDDGGGRPLEALVALTFTEKAARELQAADPRPLPGRLAAGDGAGAGGPVLRGLDAAPIGTFHEFCGRLLRRHALQAGVDPEFAILDESIAGSLRDEAVRIAIRKLLAARDADLIDLGTDYGLRQVREALGRLAAFRGAVGLEELGGSVRPKTIAEHWRPPGRRTPLADGARPRRGQSSCGAAGHSNDSTPTPPDPRAPRRSSPRSASWLRPSPPAPSTGSTSWSACCACIDLPRAASWPSPEDYEAVKTAFAELRDHLRDQVRPALDWSATDALLASAARSLRFARLALAVRREHERLKRRRRGLDFDDLLVRARDLLRDHPELAAPAIPEDGTASVEFVLVDEFQDTDGVQGEILRLLSGEAFLTGRLFVVGDVKQSIYRFRGAEPGIFRDWRSEFPARGRLSLTENFRSVPGIIGFVNALFGDCFRDLDPDGEPLARQDDDHRLLADPGRGHLPAAGRVPLAGRGRRRRPGRIGRRRLARRDKAVGARAADDRGAVRGPPPARAARRRLAGPRPGDAARSARRTPAMWRCCSAR